MHPSILYNTSVVIEAYRDLQKGREKAFWSCPVLEIKAFFFFLEKINIIKIRVGKTSGVGLL